MTQSVKIHKHCNIFDGRYYFFAECKTCSFKTPIFWSQDEAVADFKAHQCPGEPTTYYYAYSQQSVLNHELEASTGENDFSIYEIEVGDE